MASGHKTTAADEALLARLHARAVAERKAAAQEAGNRRIAAAAPRLLALLRDRNASVAAAAAWALGRLHYRPAEQPLAALLHSPSTALRKGAAWALGCLDTPGALTSLLDALQDADEATARSILLALDKWPADVVAPRLVAMLRAPGGQTRARASRALLRRPAAVAPTVLAALHAAGHGSANAAEENEVPFRRAAAYLLAQAATAEALPALLDLSGAPDPRTRLYAARGLGRLAPLAPQAGTRLRELQCDERRDVAAAASVALDGVPAVTGSRSMATAHPASGAVPLDLPAGLTYLVTVVPGLEDIAAEEIEGIAAAQVRQRKRGALLVALDAPPTALSGLRTVLDVLLFVGPLSPAPEAAERDQRYPHAAITAIAAARPDLPPSTYVHVPRGTAAPRAARLRAAAAAALAQAGARVARTGASLTAEVVVAGAEELLGIHVLPEAPGHRPLPVGGLPASLGATLAAAMVRLTVPTAADVFLDPLCGAGTLLRERALAGPYARLLGGDADERAVALARANLWGLPDLALERWDATHPPLDDAAVDKAALNPPYGRRTGSHAGNRELYPALLAELARVLRPDGLLALVTAEQRLTTALLRAQRSFAREAQRPVLAGGVGATIYLLRRRRSR
jgi:tRNA (guanine6-N2)-methyltransferase